MDAERDAAWPQHYQRVLIEICTIIYFIAKNSAVNLVPQYVYFLVQKKYNITDSETNILPIPPEGNNTTAAAPVTTAEENQIDKESSLIVLSLNLAELLPCALVILIYGLVSDATGKRRFLLWLPCLGNILYAFGLLLPLYVNGGDLNSSFTMICFVLASLVSGLSGNLPGFLSGNASYISDTDTEGRRTLRLAIVELFMGLTFGMVSFTNGIWVSKTNHFADPLWFIVACSVVPFLGLVVFLDEPYGNELKPGSSDGLVQSFRSVKYLCRSGDARLKRFWALFVAFQVGSARYQSNIVDR